MTMYLYTCVILVCVCVLQVVRSESTTCKCEVKDQCKPINKWSTVEKQVVVTTDLTSDYKDWSWDSLTTVLVLNKSLENQSELMCYAHSKGKQYGVFLDVPPSFNDTDINAFVGHTVQDVTRLTPDVVALNFVQMLGDCEYTSKHATHIADSVEKVIDGIRAGMENLTKLCVLPWKPPCYDNDCQITPKLARLCDGLILNIDSFDSYCDESCTAKPLVPYHKLMLAIQDYLSMGFDVSQVLITVPWHGYKYTCKSTTVYLGMKNTHICYLETETNVDNKTVCQYERSRSKVNIGTLLKDHPELAHQDKTYSYADQAAWYYDMDEDNTTSLTWFEDVYSLEQKYDIINKFNLKGLVVYTADDLTHTHIQTNGRHDFEEFMWSWMVHELFQKKSNLSATKDADFNYSGMAAGLGVFMFLLGTVVGVLVSCWWSRRSKKLHRPFSADMHTDDYHDDL